MAARGQIVELQVQAAVALINETDRFTVIHLQDNVGTDAELGISAEGPVLDGKSQLKCRRVVDAVRLGADQLQLRASAAEPAPNLLNGTWRCHFLQATTAGWTRPLQRLLLVATVHPARQSQGRRLG